MEKAHEKRDLSVRVGQWVRNHKNILAQYNREERLYNGAYYSNEFSKNIHIRLNSIKVENTPQELIEVGDLYELTSNITNRKQVFETTKNDSIFKIIKSGSKDIKLLTKILTPNTNGGYDLQYSALAHETE